MGTVDRFAYTLQRLARQAGNVPKNLRTLFNLTRSMEPPDPREGSSPPDTSGAELSKVAKRAIPDLRVAEVRSEQRLTRQEAACLEIVFLELQANHDVHGDRARTITATFDGPGAAMTFPFLCNAAPGGADEEETLSNWKRIERLSRGHMQRFLRPAAGHASSNGTGLYLAQLAAAVVGWRIVIQGPRLARDDETPAGGGPDRPRPDKDAPPCCFELTLKRDG